MRHVRARLEADIDDRAAGPAHAGVVRALYLELLHNVGRGRSRCAGAVADIGSLRVRNAVDCEFRRPCRRAI